MKTRLLLVIGIFLMIFSLDSILFLESAISDCKDFTGMEWFIFITSGFNPMDFMSHHSECQTSFYVETISAVLFAIGFGLVIHLIVQKLIMLRKRRKSIGEIRNEN